MKRFLNVLGIVSAFAVVLAACSSPLGDDDTESTPTVNPVSASATATVASPPSASEAETAIEITPSAPAPTASVIATATPSLGTSTGPAVTATEEPLPSDGAELTINGDPITAIVPGDETGRRLYATAGDSLWRSTDGGRTWAEAGEGDHGPMIVALNEPDVLYSGDRGGCGRGFSFFEFRRSSDAGRTWETAPESVDFEPFLAYEARDALYLYGSNCGLSVSSDAGTTWEPVADLNGEEIFAVATERSDPLAQIIVVAATEGGTGRLFLFDTDDPGRPLFLGALVQFWGDAAIDWTNGRIVVAHSHLVGVSDDGGQTWSWSRDGLEDATFSVDPFFEPLPEDEVDPFRRFDFVRIDRTDRDRIWLGGSRGAHFSSDGGMTWDRVGDGVPITGIVLSTVSDRVFISSDSGTRLWALSDS